MRKIAVEYTLTLQKRNMALKPTHTQVRTIEKKMLFSRLSYYEYFASNNNVFLSAIQCAIIDKHAYTQ